MTFLGCHPSNKFLWSDFCLNLRLCTDKLWQNRWETLPLNFGTWYRTISITIPHHPCFRNTNLSRKSIISFSWFRFGHTLLPFLSLNSLPPLPYIFKKNLSNFDIPHILFNCLKLSSKRDDRISLFKTYFLIFNAFFHLSNQTSYSQS